MRGVYKNGQLSHYYACDKCYTYLVHLTPVDDLIRKLFYYFDFFENKKLIESEYENIRNLISELKAAEIYGWILIKAEKIFCK